MEQIYMCEKCNGSGLESIGCGRRVRACVACGGTGEVEVSVDVPTFEEIGELVAA